MAKSSSRSGGQVKDDRQYEALRDEGMSKQKAARIANTPNAGKKGGRQPAYEDWTRDQLYDKAREVGIDGRSRMNKTELKRALRGR